VTKVERTEKEDVTPLIAAESEALYRRVNERIFELSHATTLARDLFVCECGNPGCSCRLELTRGEYERVRAVPGRFVVAIGHADTRLEAIVEANDRYLVVATVATPQVVAPETDTPG